jgi:hypothetical protein
LGLEASEMKDSSFGGNIMFAKPSFGS